MDGLLFYIFLTVNKSNEKHKINNVAFPLQIHPDFLTLSVVLRSKPKSTWKQLKINPKHKVSFKKNKK